MKVMILFFTVIFKLFAVFYLLICLYFSETEKIYFELNAWKEYLDV
jgi:hypothetical protein